MSNYKHGNWYCKPANESEAREIVERALESGAEKDETLKNYSWDEYGAWGVRNGLTHTQRMDFYRYEDAIEYTIEQVRELFLLPDEQKEKAPIYTHEYRYSQGVYKLCRVVVSETDTLGKILVEDQYGEYDLIHPANLRPLKSERDKWVESVLKLHYTNKLDLKSFVGTLYDSIKSGDLKAPEVE